MGLVGCLFTCVYYLGGLIGLFVCLVRCCFIWLCLRYGLVILFAWWCGVCVWLLVFCLLVAFVWMCCTLRLFICINVTLPEFVGMWVMCVLFGLFCCSGNVADYVFLFDLTVVWLLWNLLLMYVVLCFGFNLLLYSFRFLVGLLIYVFILPCAF